MATKVWSAKSGIIRASDSSAVNAQRWLPSAGFAPEGRVVAEKKLSGVTPTAAAITPGVTPAISPIISPTLSSMSASEPGTLTPEEEALVSISALRLLPEELEHIREQAFKEGEAEGRKLGYEEGKVAGKLEVEATFEERFAREIEPRVQQMQAPLIKILETIEAEVPQLDGIIAEQIVDLALLIAQQMTCSAIKFNRTIILSIFDHAIHALPREARGLLQIYLHPDDAKILKEFLVHQLKAEEHRVFIDSDIQRGGCRLVSRLGELDATLEDRWKTLIKNLGRDMAWLSLEGSPQSAPLELELNPGIPKKEADTDTNEIEIVQTDTSLPSTPSADTSVEANGSTEKKVSKKAAAQLSQVQPTQHDEKNTLATASQNTDLLIDSLTLEPEPVKKTPAKKKSAKKTGEE